MARTNRVLPISISDRFILQIGQKAKFGSGLQSLNFRFDRNFRLRFPTNLPYCLERKSAILFLFLFLWLSCFSFCRCRRCCRCSNLVFLSPSSKDAEVGDGTTSVVLLASEFLAQLRPYIEEGVHPQVVIRAMRKGTKMSVDKIKEIAVKVGHGYLFFFARLIKT